MSGRIRVSDRVLRTYDGIVFASRAEMKRYCELRMMERAGLIKDLELQPVYILLSPFMYRGRKIQGITYRADFRYLDTRINRNIVEDVKGHITDIYCLKKKLLLAKYPDINFVEVEAR